MSLAETDLQFIQRALSEIASECGTGKDHNFHQAIHKLVKAHQADRARIDALEREIAFLKQRLP